MVVAVEESPTVFVMNGLFQSSLCCGNPVKKVHFEYSIIWFIVKISMIFLFPKTLNMDLFIVNTPNMGILIVL